MHRGAGGEGEVIGGKDVEEKKVREQRRLWRELNRRGAMTQRTAEDFLLISFLAFLLGPPVIGFIAEGASLRYSYGLIAILGLCTVVLAGSRGRLWRELNRRGAMTQRTAEIFC